MQSWRSLGVLGALVVLAGCGSGNSTVGFQTGDGSVDASQGAETGTLHRGKDGGGGNNKDGSTHTLGNPDTGGGTCSKPVTCASAGANCGSLSNGCGGTVQCGTCLTPETCGGGGTANVCGTPCTPKTCADLGFNCGPAGDGCGGSLNCGTCGDGGTCGGGGTASQCGSSTTCVPKTCAELGFNCGPAGDGCGNQLQCGTCTGSDSCGGGGTASVCGAPMCTPKTCAELGFTCGPASDGCGNELQCGTCTAPTACGGGGKPGVCGCTGTCAELPTCTAGMTTTLTGFVYDPADIHPLYNVLVYIPNDPADPALTSPFPAGVTCDQCGATAAGDPLVTANTAPDGSFKLSNIPVGSSIPLVIQLGRWRRQYTVDVSTSCGANALSSTNTQPDKWLAATQPLMPADGHLTFPTNSTLGDIPRIGILTGGFDPVECVLRKMGVDDSEFTNPGGTGHIQFYLAAQPNQPASPFEGASPGECPPNPAGYGAQINASTPNQAALFATTGGPGGTPEINTYDVVILACEGYEETQPAADWAQLGTYTGAGGRVLASDFAYDWLAATKTCQHTSNCPAGTTCEGAGGGQPGTCIGVGNVTQNPAFPGVATWDTFSSDNAVEGTSESASIDLVSNPVGTDFQSWLQDISIVSAGSDVMTLNPVFQATTGVIAPTQQWLHWDNTIPIQFTFNTPVGAAAASQCGRVNFMDWHADTLGFSPDYPACELALEEDGYAPYPTTAPFYSHGMTFPTECDSGPMTPQEAVVEFMLFDVSSCVTPYQATCTSESCAQQGINCGPAGDGCGNLIQCGTCPAGETCGGGGTPSVCGSSCDPKSCAAQGIQCGPAGDGCGNSLSCGTCPAGQTCGAGGMPGICGSGTCTPRSCAAQNIACGPAGDGCGNALSCGSCPTGQTCGGGGTPGVCGAPACTPKTCTELGINCGPAGDGCGNELACGMCPSGETCGGGGTPGQCGSGGPK